MDQSDGGQASRYSLSGEWRQASGNVATTVNAYVIRQKLDLFSNFTYFLDNPVDGDQFAQPDRRTTTGVNVSQTYATTLFGRIGYKFNPKLKIELEGFNLTNRKASAIDYTYESQLKGEASLVSDIHFHPIESRSFRVTLVASF